MTLCKLTVRFDEPFWIGLIEVEDGESYSAARHVFGAEPSTPEVFDFIRDHWSDLRFAPEVELDIQPATCKRINPKRLRRMIEKEVRSNARRGTKAQQALAEQREASAEAKAALSRRQREERKRAQFAKRTEKRKQKHRGH